MVECEQLTRFWKTLKTKCMLASWIDKGAFKVEKGRGSNKNSQR